MLVQSGSFEPARTPAAATQVAPRSFETTGVKPFRLQSSVRPSLDTAMAPPCFAPSGSLVKAVHVAPPSVEYAPCGSWLQTRPTRTTKLGSFSAKSRPEVPLQLGFWCAPLAGGA